MVRHEAMQYLQDLGAVDEASALLTEALAALPANALMHFLAAEFEQQRKNVKVWPVFQPLSVSLCQCVIVYKPCPDWPVVPCPCLTL
jgi:hypothetical protein